MQKRGQIEYIGRVILVLLTLVVILLLIPSVREKLSELISNLFNWIRFV